VNIFVEEFDRMDGFWINESPDAIVVCDKEGKLLVMNEKAAKIFETSGGKALVGKSMFNCHPETIQPKIKALLANPRTITYTDELNGAKQLIHMNPWYKDGVYSGMVEMILDVPLEIPNNIK